MASDDPILHLLDLHFEGGLTPDQRRELEERLRRDPAARRIFWNRAHWDNALHTWGAQNEGRDHALESGASPASAPCLPPAALRCRRRRVPVIRQRWFVLAAAVAITFAAVVFAWQRLNARSALAQLNFASADVVWSIQPHSRTDAATLTRGHYELDRGIVRFETAAGALVTVAAPARFELRDATHIELTTGRLTARMLSDAATLTVHVDDFSVQDLGTAFGIHASPHAPTLVSVFDGEVAVRHTRDTTPPLRLLEGQSVVNARDSRAAPASTTFSTDDFTGLWPLTVGIDESSDLVSFLPPGPLLRPLHEYLANDRLFLFPERQQVRLASSLASDISPAAPEWPAYPVSPYPVPRDAVVSSYLVFFQPDPAASEDIRRLRGQIVFQRRILGVICSDRGLAQSDPLVGHPAAEYRIDAQRRGLEEASKENYRSATLPHDSLRIEPDGRTLSFDFYVADEREQMRVIVATD